MAAEAVLVKILSSNGLETRTVADGTGLEKGTILKFSADPNTAAASSADGDLFAGILAEEKVASDGQTEVSVWMRDAIFALTTGASHTGVLGNHCSIVGANLVGDADVTTLTDFGEIVGRFLETASNDEVVQVSLGQ